MDIVNRLTAFMETRGIGSTQFADSCGIPRPTLSQILSGRNKKISDAVIAKIHKAYPRLSVMWLLFGEGEMEMTPNMAISEAQNKSRNTVQSAQTNDYRGFEGTSRNMGNESADTMFGAAGAMHHDTLIFDDDDDSANVVSDEDNGTNDANMESTVAVPADGSKSIVNIMVFYSDNSYQSFVPR